MLLHLTVYVSKCCLATDIVEYVGNNIAILVLDVYKGETNGRAWSTHTRGKKKNVWKTGWSGFVCANEANLYSRLCTRRFHGKANVAWRNAAEKWAEKSSGNFLWKCGCRSPTESQTQIPLCEIIVCATDSVYIHWKCIRIQIHRFTLCAIPLNV